ncbi:hypothetical protein F5878DRAFT_376183 [Lentinula raphanica]|uniref:Uncharacterized protein n=1 Tax=Lentinula raphanica TaxID=153919 RepID=A0AA38U824_9AGAR|nr:hypothetical protein F5878DRAFT_376183 [Lentinula raphanica]
MMSSSSAAGSCLQNPDVMKKGDFLNRVRETVPGPCPQRQIRLSIKKKYSCKEMHYWQTHPFQRTRRSTLPAQPNSADPFADPANGNVSVCDFLYTYRPRVTHTEKHRLLQTSILRICQGSNPTSDDSLDSIRTHAKDTVVQTTSRHPSDRHAGSGDPISTPFEANYQCHACTAESQIVHVFFRSDYGVRAQ